MAKIYTDAQGRQVYDNNGQIVDAKTGQVIGSTPLSGTGTPAPSGEPILPQGGILPTTAPALPDTDNTESPLLSFASSLDAAVNLARKSRNASSFDIMKSSQGTVAASDFNSILSNINAASDSTSKDLIKRATEADQITYDTLSDSTGAIYQVQKDSTGKIIGKPELLFKGKSGTGDGTVTLSAGQKDDIATMDTLSVLASQVEGIAKNNNDSLPGVGPFFGGSIGGFTSAKLGFGGDGEKGQQTRDLVGNIAATIAKLRGGTSFTANEQALLERYTPTVDDDDKVIKQKLKDLVNFIAIKKQQTLKVSGGDYSNPKSETSSTSFSGTTSSGLKYTVTP